MNLARYKTVWILLLLTAVFASLSCAPEEPEESDEAPPPVDLGTLAQTLLAHRSVDIDVWSTPGQLDSVKSSRTGLFVDSGVMRALRDACDDAEVSQALGRAQCSSSVDIIVRNLCMGHWAQTIAETLRPVHMGKIGTTLDYIVMGDERPQGKAYAGVAATPLTTAYTIRPPKPADRTTWSLLATAMYARAADEGSTLLPFSCGDDEVKTYLSVQLADAVSSLESSMNTALSRLAASTALKRGQANSPGEAAQAEWRGATDSRLESASLLAYIPPDYWERVPVYLATHADEGQVLVAGDDSALPDGFTKAQTTPIGYVLRTPSHKTQQLRTCREERLKTVGGTTTRRTVWVTASSAETGASALCNRAEVNWRVEGYLLSTQASGMIGVYRRDRADGFVTDLVFSSPRETDKLLGYMYSPTQKSDGSWPIYADGFIDAQTELAEDLLVTTRINPALSGADLANTLLQALNADFHGAYNDVASGSELLTRFDLQLHHLEDAARRIRARAELFGVPIIKNVRHTGLPARYTLPEPNQLRAPHPAYLYARTQGGGLPYDLFDTQKLNTDPLQLTIPDVMASFVKKYKTAVRGSSMPTAAINVLAQAASQVSQTIMGTVEVRAYERLRIQNTTPRTGLSLGMTQLQFTVSDAATGPLEVWVGRSSLACLTRGRIGRAPCEPRDYLASGATVSGNVVTLTPAQLPPAAYGQTAALTTFPVDEPIFIAHRLPGRPPQVLFGLYPPTPRGVPSAPIPNPGTEVVVNYRVAEGALLTPWLEEALSAALAVDPEDPSQALMSCSGLPTAVIPSRVKLEDELTATTNREDDIDDSFDYYLSEARAAAQRADELGEQLYEQGLQMDMRAEAAVEELEELCGGTINVGLLREYACQIGSCDLSTILSSHEADIPPELRSELAGVRDCLGITAETAPEWVAIGDQPLCAWRFKGQGSSPKFGPCTPCPAGVACPDRCPLNPTPVDCAAALSGFPQVEAVEVKETLDLTVTDFDAVPQPDDLPSWLFARWLTLDTGKLPQGQAAAFKELREGKYKTAGVDLPTTSSIREEWATQDHLYRLAGSIGYEQDFDNNLKFTLNGNTWFRVPRRLEEFRTPDATDDAWPCKALTPEVASLCTPALLQEYKNAGYERPLVCGVCDATQSDTSNRTKIEKRLKSAVKWLKRVTGAGSGNVLTLSKARDEDVGTVRLNSGGTLRQQGRNENGDYYTVYREDRERVERCYDRVDDQSTLRCFSIERGALTPPYDAGFLWSKRNCLSDDVVAAMPGSEEGESAMFVSQTETGCGAMADFFDGKAENLSVSWTTEEWVGKPGEFCIRYYDMFGNGWVDCFDSALAAEINAAQYEEAEVLREGAIDRTEERVSGQVLIDAITLAYAAERSGGGTCATLMREMPPIESVRDFTKVKQMLMCAADDVERRLSQMFIPNLPRDVIEDLQMRSVSGSFPRHRGQYGEALARLLATAQNLVRNQSTVVQQIRNLGNEFDIGAAQLETLDLNLQADDLDAYIAGLQLENAESQVKIVDLNGRIANLRTQQATANMASSCTLAGLNAMPTVTCGFPSGCSSSVSTGAILAAVETCSNAKEQARLEEAVGALGSEANGLEGDQADNNVLVQEAVLSKARMGQQVTEAEKRIALLEMQRAAAEKADAINETVVSLNETYAELHALITEIERIRARSRRAVAKAMLLDSDDVGRQFSVNTSMRARMNSLRARYEQAREAAIRSAYIARRALEQKLGVNLASLRKSVAGVRAPSEWIDEVCSLNGLDLSDLRESLVSEEAKEALREQLQSDTLTDYVERLADLKDAYRNAYPFQDGDDVMVVSLRDELLNVRESCEVEGTNLLLESQSMMGSPWQIMCSATHCAEVSPSADQPFQCDSGDREEIGRCPGTGGTPAVELRAAVRGEHDPEEDLTVETAQYYQYLGLSPGNYWLSWFEKSSCDGASTLLAHVQLGQEVETLAPVDADCIDSARTPTDGHLSDRWIREGWSRRIVFVKTQDAMLTGVGFGPRALPAAGVTSQPFTMAAPQVERVSKLISTLPNDFFATDDDRMAMVGECEDTDGDQFRSTSNWEYGCEYYCPVGASEHCERWADRSQLASRCFHETSFRISQSDIEIGKLITQGGFSAGNFNYRHNLIGVNVVGTAVRSCAGSNLPSSCNANNFLQYTLHHDGPFRVRNYDGQNYYAPLYPGRIQQSKALTAERYITNPVSSADSQLITPYMRSEFRGRPLEGNYTLRVYDSPELDWSRVEDVQLMFNYRYWTRLE